MKSNPKTKSLNLNGIIIPNIKTTLKFYLDKPVHQQLFHRLRYIAYRNHKIIKSNPKPFILAMQGLWEQLKRKYDFLQGKDKIFEKQLMKVIEFIQTKYLTEEYKQSEKYKKIRQKTQERNRRIATENMSKIAKIAIDKMMKTFSYKLTYKDVKEEMSTRTFYKYHNNIKEIIVWYLTLIKLSMYMQLKGIKKDNIVTELMKLVLLDIKDMKDKLLNNDIYNIEDYIIGLINKARELYLQEYNEEVVEHFFNNLLSIYRLQKYGSFDKNSIFLFSSYIDIEEYKLIKGLAKGLV